jgi:uncharacterized protein (TIGR02996 family)
VDERVVLLAAVFSDPADATRLVLADWLEENGEAEFGRFLRAGVAADFHWGKPVGGNEEAAATLAELAAAGLPGRWLAALGVGPPPRVWVARTWELAGGRVTARTGAAEGVFERGMLASLVAPLAVWREAAPRALAAWPLKGGVVSDTPGLSSAGRGARGGGWRRSWPWPGQSAAGCTGTRRWSDRSGPRTRPRRCAGRRSVRSRSGVRWWPGS